MRVPGKWVGGWTDEQIDVWTGGEKVDGWVD